MLHLGVDGGNTKTIALLATGAGEVVGMGRAGCSDIFHAPDSRTAMDELAAAVSEALRSAGSGARSLASAVLSLAGVDWPEDATLVRSDFLSRFAVPRCLVANDALGGLRAGTPDGVGIVLACGTGGAIGARNAAGAFWHSGFWAESMGGSELGREAIRMVTRAELGLAPPTPLTAALLRHFEVSSVEAMVRALNGHDVKPLGNVAQARLAPLVMDAAAAGDTVALDIVERQGQLLADYARVAAGKVSLDAAEAPLVLTGGVFRHASPVLAEAVARPLGRPLAGFLRPRREPAVGALMLALEEAGIALTGKVLQTIDATAPGGALYRTAG